jgi:endonuclease YncB( thermonuclease family)
MAPAKPVRRIVITNPEVESNGSIIANGETYYLYGIKPFNSRQVCTRASGERWACGLHAYATLRNTLAHKTIVCDPKNTLPNGLSVLCRIGSTDVASILVGSGVAELDGSSDDADLAKAQDFAKSHKLGIWNR